MRKVVLTYGLIGGAIMSALMLVSLSFQDRIGFDRSVFVGYAGMVLAFLMVYVGVRTYRDTEAGGSITFGRALGVGMLIVAITTVCYVATWELIYYKLAPDFSDKYAAYVIEKARASGATEAQIAVRTKEMQEFRRLYQNPLVNIAYTLLEPLPVGVLFALVSAGMLSRKRRGEAATAPV